MINIRMSKLCMEEYPFYHFSSFHGKPKKEEELPLKFVSSASTPLFDDHFDSQFEVRHFPNMDSVFLTPKERFNVTVYYPSSIKDELKFHGVGKLAPGSRFEMDKYTKIDQQHYESHTFSCSFIRRRKQADS